MYRGFNLKNIILLPDYLTIGQKIYDQQLNKVAKVLDQFVSPDGIIDGSALQENWFPNMNHDIFISHSHADKDIALSLAGALGKLGLSCFIDSVIWGYSDNLLRIIDEKHCYNKQTGTFDYNSRNATTSHVHMMLSNALFRMIDNTECLFFINSNNSIKVEGVINKTLSPWIYTEIAASQIIRKIKPIREIHKAEDKAFSEIKNLNESISIDYDVNLAHLTELNVTDIINWIEHYNHKKEHALDTLYRVKPIKKLYDGSR